MSAPTDIVQAVQEAIVAALSSDATVQAITGRTSENVIDWNSLTTEALPVIAYLVSAAREVGGLAYTWDVDVQLSAFATVNADANRLAERARVVLIAPTFASLPNPLDAYSMNRIVRTLPFDQTSDSYRTDLTLQLTVTMATP